MMRRKKVTAGVLLLATAGLLMPSPVLADGNRTAWPIADVALGQGNVLWGQVLDSDGKPQAGIAVSVCLPDRQLSSTRADGAGRFSFLEVPSGVYILRAGAASCTCRLWAPETAPPGAKSGILLVADATPVRSQNGPVAYWLSNPWVLAGVVAGAVAIPVLINNHRSHRSASP
jgi:hypothetical protein